MKDPIEEAYEASEEMAARENRTRLLRRILRQIRTRHDETGAKMAKRIDISPSMLSSIESGVRVPPQTFPSMVIDAYKLRGRERDSFLVACVMASDLPLEIDMENKCYNEAYMRVAFFLANMLAEADIEALQWACINIENSIMNRRYGRDAAPISQRAELPVYLPDGWGEDEEEIYDNENIDYPPIRYKLPDVKANRKKQDTKNIGDKENTDNED